MDINSLASIKVLSHVYAGVCLIGLIGNILAIIILSRKRFENSIFSTYFRILTLFNLLTILGRTDFLLTTNQVISIRNLSSTVCKLYKFIVYIFPATSKWITMLISIDRFLSIVKPSRFLIRKEVKYQFFACFLSFFVNLLFYIPVIFKFDIIRSSNQTVENCLPTDKILVNLLDIIWSTTFPFIIMLLCTIFTLSYIFKSRRNATNSSRSSNNQKSKDIRFAIISIYLNISFLILNLPQNIYLIFFYSDRIEIITDKIIYIILSIFLYSYYGEIFYASLIINSIFRKEFISFILELKLKIYNLF